MDYSPWGHKVLDAIEQLSTQSSPPTLDTFIVVASPQQLLVKQRLLKGEKERKGHWLFFLPYDSSSSSQLTGPGEKTQPETDL